MEFTFTNKPEAQADVPYFEDTRAKETKYYTSTKSLAAVLKEVRQEFQELGCYNISFAEGYFGVKPKRYGYLVTFGWNGAQGKIPLAGLPLRNEPFSYQQKQTKINKVRVQALLILRDHLISYRQAPMFMVNTMPMLQHLLVDGERTLSEYLQQVGTLPGLPAPQGDIVETDFVEVE